jgi:hypothetical protein
MMNWILGGSAFVALAACAIMSWLYARAKIDAKDADSARNAANQTVKELASEFNDYRASREAQLHALRGKIKELENELLTCTTPGARRKLINSLLQKAGSKG